MTYNDAKTFLNEVANFGPDHATEKDIDDALTVVRQHESMNGYIICNNDSTEFIVIGTEQEAKTKLVELKSAAHQRCRRDYGVLQGDVMFERHYWHIHDCDFAIYHQTREPHATPT